jgi:hypothetical protein
MERKSEKKKKMVRKKNETADNVNSREEQQTQTKIESDIVEIQQHVNDNVQPHGPKNEALQIRRERTSKSKSLDVAMAQQDAENFQETQHSRVKKKGEKKLEQQPTEIRKNTCQPIGGGLHEEQPIRFKQNNQLPRGFETDEQQPDGNKEIQQDQPIGVRDNEEEHPIGAEIGIEQPIGIESDEKRLPMGNIEEEKSPEIQNEDEKSAPLWIFGKYSPKKKCQSLEASVDTDRCHSINSSVVSECAELGMSGALMEEECGGGWEYPIQGRQQVLEEAARRKYLCHPTQVRHRSKFFSNRTINPQKKYYTNFALNFK